MLGTNLRCLDNLNGIWGFDTSNSLQTTSYHETRKDRNGVRRLYVRDERIMVTWEWISMKQGT